MCHFKYVKIFFRQRAVLELLIKLRKKKAVFSVIFIKKKCYQIVKKRKGKF